MGARDSAKKLYPSFFSEAKSRILRTQPRIASCTVFSLVKVVLLRTAEAGAKRGGGAMLFGGRREGKG